MRDEVVDSRNRGIVVVADGGLTRHVVDRPERHGRLRSVSLNSATNRDRVALGSQLLAHVRDRRRRAARVSNGTVGWEGEGVQHGILSIELTAS